MEVSCQLLVPITLAAGKESPENKGQKSEYDPEPSGRDGEEKSLPYLGTEPRFRLISR
jgi:hypothetical protein